VGGDIYLWTPGHGIRNLRDVILTGKARLPVNPGLCSWGQRPTSGGLGGPQYMVWAGCLATILSWSGRPRDRSPGCVCRHSTRYD